MARSWASLAWGQGAPRTCRCIETRGAGVLDAPKAAVREHHAPVGALRPQQEQESSKYTRVREHHAPVGALRRHAGCPGVILGVVREHHAPVGALRLSHPGSEGYSGCIQVLGGAGGVGGMVRGGVCPNLPQRRSGPGSAVSRGAEYQRFFSCTPVRSGSLWQIWTTNPPARTGRGGCLGERTGPVGRGGDPVLGHLR